MEKIWILMIIGTLLISGVIAVEMTQNVTVNILPGGIDVYSPVQDALYLDRMVPINLTMSTEVLRFEYFDNGDGPGTLCRNCDEYGYSRLKRKPFDDGFRQMRIAAVFDEGEVYHYVNFTVDTQEPRIIKTSPSKGFATGIFEVEFKEINPVLLELNYGTSNPGIEKEEVDLESCIEEKGKTSCEIEVDLSEFDEEEISYWFYLEDIAGNNDTSKARKLNVDLSDPVINFFNYSINKKSVTFLFNISEPNFADVSYIDLNSTNPKWKILCNKLKNGICEKKKAFKTGNHSVELQVSDEAGNSIGFSIEFEII